uniref:7TM GPCR serpentine receptor class x (Srx) domain-containing protein n=1 Tax=Plectus sambesii TaxID=2011161 RepID=A0A914X2U6_9BILA
MNSTDSALGDGRIPLEHWLIGVSLSSAALIVICLYIPCIMVFLDKDLRSFAAYTFMLHIGVFDLIQAVMHFVSGILTIVPYGYPTHSFDWIVGGMAEAAWQGYISLNVVLAINRFLQMAMPTRTDRLFSSRLIKLYILLAYLYMLAWLIFFYSNTCKFVYNKSIYTYHFDFSMPGCGLASDINGLLILGTWSIAPKYITMTPYHYFAISVQMIIISGSNPLIYLLFNP